jgi:hypothetical protein
MKKAISLDEVGLDGDIYMTRLVKLKKGVYAVLEYNRNFESPDRKIIASIGWSPNPEVNKDFVGLFSSSTEAIKYIKENVGY